MDSEKGARPTQWLVVCLGFAVIMADGFDLQFIGLIGTEVMREWSLSPAAFGALASAALLGSIAGAVLAGFASRRIGLRATLIGALLLFGGFTLAGLLAQTATTLAALRFIAGIGLGAAVPVTVSIVDEHSSPRWRALAMTLAVCGQPIGAILGGLLCAQFIPIFGWRFTFVLGGVVPLLLIPFVLRLSSGAALAVAEGRLRELLSADLWKTTALLWMTVFQASCFIYLIVTWLPGTLRESGASLPASVWAMSLFNFGGIVGAALAAACIDRYGPFKVMPVMFGIAAVATVMLGTLLSLPAAYPLVLFSGVGGYGAAMVLGSVTALIYPPRLRTFGVGCLLGVGRWGGAIGPTLLGWAKSAGLPTNELFWYAALAPCIALVCLLALARVQPAGR